MRSSSVNVFRMNQWSKAEILAPLLNDILSMPSHKSWPLLPIHLQGLLCIDVGLALQTAKAHLCVSANGNANSWAELD